MDGPTNLAKGDSAKLSVSDLDSEGHLASLPDVANLIDGVDISGLDGHYVEHPVDGTCLQTELVANLSAGLIDGHVNQCQNDDQVDTVGLLNDSMDDDSIRQHAALLVEQIVSESVASLHALQSNDRMLIFQSESISPADANPTMHDITNPSASSESASQSDSSATSNQSANKTNKNKRKNKNYRKKSNSSSSSTSTGSPVSSKAKTELTSPKVVDSCSKNEVKTKTPTPRVEVKCKKNPTTSHKADSVTAKASLKTEFKCQSLSSSADIKTNGEGLLTEEVNKSTSATGQESVKCDANLLANPSQSNTPASKDSEAQVDDLLATEPSAESSLVTEPSDDQSMEDADLKTKSKTFGQNVADESLCRICSKHVYHMEQIKAVKCVFHKVCFRCKECNKQLNVDSYSSHEGIIYCKPHFKQLFQPKAVFENGHSLPMPARKYELIICENTPQELPADVVRSSAKQDDLLENINLDLSNIRNRFENGNEKNSEGKKSTEKILTRSESIHKIMQKYQSRVAGDKDITSSSDEEDNTNLDSPSGEKVAFSGMSALKSQWESGSINANAKSENRVEEELAELRQKVKTSEPVKQAYERAVQEAKSVENLASKHDNIVSDCSVKAVSIKEKFEKGNVDSETEEDKVERSRKEREEEISRIAVSETCTKEARNKFKQIEANMGKEQQSNGANGQIEDSIGANDLQQRFKYFENLKDNQFAKDSPNDETDSKTDDIPKADTTKKMLDKFKALEAGQTNGQVNVSPKSPKRITPPRETSIKTSENEPLVERDPNIVKSSYKSDDDIQVEPEKAKNLRAKFENWQAEIASENRKTEEDDYVPHIDTTKNLRAMFESIKEEYKPTEKPRPRINRFVDNKAPVGEVCYVCSARLYPMEKMEFSGIKIHKNCFRCNKCHAPLRLDNFTVRAEKLFCIPHFKQLFMEKGNYDEGFGLEQHKDKWSHKTTNGKANGTELAHDNESNEPSTNGNGNGISFDDQHSDVHSMESEAEHESLDNGHHEPELQQHQSKDELEYEERRQLELDEILDGPVAVDNLL